MSAPVIPGQEKGAATLDAMYSNIRRSYREGYTISTALKDSLVNCSESARDFDAQLGRMKSEDKMKYYTVLILSLRDTEEARDSLYLLQKQIDRDSLAIDHRVLLHRRLGIAYDHFKDSAKALELFFGVFENGLTQGDSLLIKTFSNHINYIITSRFPNTPQWIKRKKDMAAQLNGNYGLRDVFKDYSRPNVGFQEDVILSKLPDESHYFDGYENDLQFVRSTWARMQQEVSEISNPERRKHLLDRGYRELVSYFDGRDKGNNLYYNVVHSYILYLFSQKRYTEAAFFSDSLKDILPTDIGYDFFDYVSFYGHAANAHKALGNFERSLFYSEKENTHNFKQTYNIEKTYDYLLDKINGVHQARIELEWINDKKRSAIIIIAISAVSALGLIMLYMSFVHGRRLKKSRNSALQMIQEKERLEGKVEMLESVISRDLHDNFGNRITGILHSYEIMKEINQTENLNSELFSKFNTNFEKGLSELLTDIKDLVWVNDPQNNSLDRLLYRLADHFEKTDCKVTVLSSLEKDIVLPKFWNRQLFLIFKEALENACNHSGAEQIHLKVHGNGKDRLVLETTDNGSGFNVLEVATTRGLDNMDKRAKSIGGHLQVTSSPKQGTSIRFTSSEFEMHPMEARAKTPAAL